MTRETFTVLESNVSFVVVSWWRNSVHSVMLKTNSYVGYLPINITTNTTREELERRDRRNDGRGRGEGEVGGTEGRRGQRRGGRGIRR